MQGPVCWWQCAVMFGKLQGKASTLEHCCLCWPSSSDRGSGGMALCNSGITRFIQFSLFYQLHIFLAGHISGCPNEVMVNCSSFVIAENIGEKKNIWVLLFPRVLEMVLECVYCQTRVAEVTLSKMWTTLFLIFTNHTGQISNWSYEQLQKPQIQRWQNCMVIIEYKDTIYSTLKYYNC